MTLQMQRVAVLVFVIGIAVVMPVTFIPDDLRTGYYVGVGTVLLLGSVWLWASVVFLVWRKRRAGAVLLDLGPPRREGAASAGSAALAVALAGWAVVTLGTQMPVIAVGYLGYSGHEVLQACLPFLGRVQFRQSGIALPAQFIPWMRIGSYAVSDRATYMDLALRYRTWVPVQGYPWEVSIFCPASRWTALATILAQHVPAKFWRPR